MSAFRLLSRLNVSEKESETRIASTININESANSERRRCPAALQSAYAGTASARTWLSSVRVTSSRPDVMAGSWDRMAGSEMSAPKASEERKESIAPSKRGKAVIGHGVT
jgi:hypothetical protein